MKRLKSKNIVILVSAFLIGMGLMYIGPFQEFRKENLALRLQLKMQEQERKRPKPWTRLLTANSPSAPQAQEESQQEEDTEQTQSPIEEQATTQLAAQLNQIMADAQAASLDKIERAIAIADELIAREPLVYSSYKAKLILMLIKEGKFSENIDDNEVNFLLNEMASFDLSVGDLSLAPQENQQLLLEEALRESKRDQKFQKLDERLDDAAMELAMIQIQLESIEPDSQRQTQLLEREQVLARQIDELQTTLQEAAAPDVIEQKIIEIPLQRELAKEEYAYVISDASALLETFPGSVAGYYYLIKALELSGRTEEAFYVLENAQLSQAKLGKLQSRLNQNKDPKAYWQDLTF
ncbi:MAG: hypothetical protein WD025_02480 [Bacteriovoracaceae bacterium]